MINVSSFLLSTKCFIFNRMWYFGTIYYKYYSKKVHKNITNNFGILGELTKISKNFNQKWMINTWFFSFFTKDFIFNHTWNFNMIYYILWSKKVHKKTGLKNSKKMWFYIVYSLRRENFVFGSQICKKINYFANHNNKNFLFLPLINNSFGTLLERALCCQDPPI